MDQRLGQSGCGWAVLGWAVHLASLLGVFVGVYVLGWWWQWHEGWESRGLLELAWEHSEGLRGKYGLQRVLEAWGVVGMIAAMLEFATVVVAWIVLPWAARPEAVQRSYGRSLRRVWWATPIVGGAILAGVGLSILHEWCLDWIGWSPYLDPAADPWEWAVVALLPVVGGIALGVGALWGVLAVVGRGTWGERCEWSGRCEGCGYTLTGLTDRAACPECGRGVSESLGREHRPGLRWHGGVEERVRSWLSRTWLALVDPAALGRAVRVYDAGRDHRWFLAVTLAATLTGGVIIEVMLWGVANGRDFFGTLRQVVPGLIFGVTAAGVTLVLVLLGPLLLGRPIGRSTKRSLLPGTLQVSCYASGVAAVGVTLLAIVIRFVDKVRIGWLHGVARQLGLGYGAGETLAGFGILGLSVLLLAGWAVTLWRGFKPLRYANE